MAERLEAARFAISNARSRAPPQHLRQISRVRLGPKSAGVTAMMERFRMSPLSSVAADTTDAARAKALSSGLTPVTLPQKRCSNLCERDRVERLTALFGRGGEEIPLLRSTPQPDRRGRRSF
jgi:hypothetical protein